MENRNAIIDILNRAIRIEHTLAMQAEHQALTVAGIDRLQLAPFFEKLGEEARQHARKFGRKVVALGGQPSVEMGQIVFASTAHDMLTQDLALEREAMRIYLQARELAGHDVALTTMLEDHIQGEQQHIEELALLTKTAGEAETADERVLRAS